MPHPCPVSGCSVTFTQSYSVYPHLKKTHDWTAAQVNKLKEDRASEAEKEKKERQAQNAFECPHCEERFKTTKTLNQHIGRSHSQEKPDLNTVFCPLDNCNERYRTREDLALHCAEDHATEGHPFIIEEKSFQDVADFKDWKKRFENSTRSSFTAESKQGRHRYYWCSRANRDRRDPESQKPNKSTKSICYCPAFMIVRFVDDGPVHVRFCRDHLGHDLKLSKLPLNEDERKHLFSLIDQGYDFARLKMELRKGGRTSRIWWLTERQIRRYAYRRKNVEFVLHSNDHQSVVERFQSGAVNGLRLANYDPTDTDSTTFVIITDEQVEWIRKYGNRCIIIDDTFRTTRHQIRLLTFLVLDDYDRGLPAAHLLSYHVTADEVAVLFKEVLKLVPQFDPKYFMSDAAGALFNGFKKAMPNSTATRLICMWHWRKFVKEQVQAKYKDDKERGGVVNATIQRLCGILDRAQFNSELNSFISSLEEEEGDGFLRYFRPWAKDRDVWAPYNRKDSPVNTSMMSEAYHKVLKYKWLPKSGNARLDELVHTLLWVPGDIEEEHEIEDDQGLFEGKYRLMENYKRHRSAIAGYSDQKDKLERTTRTTWNAQSEEGQDIYVVTDKGEERCDCEESNLHCYGCASCPRRFDCSCPDGRKAGICCKHIHACLLFSSHQVQEIRCRVINMAHDYFSLDDPVDADLQRMDAQVDDEEEEERQRKEQTTALNYQDAYQILNEAKKRIDLTRKNQNPEKLEAFVIAMRAAIEELDQPDGRGNATRPNRARGHVQFIPALVAKDVTISEKKGEAEEIKSDEATNASEEDGEPFYDKTSSFFDRLSCEVLEKAEGKKSRPDWRKERETNQEMFGHQAVRSLNYRRGFGRGMRGGRQNGGGRYNNGFNSYTNSGYNRGYGGGGAGGSRG